MLNPGALFAPVADRKTIGLAVSGGADSLALMLLAARWQQEQAAPEIRVYSLDHGLRPEAAAETEKVAQHAQELGFSARVLRWGGAKPRTGLQAAARAARYRLIGAAMEQDGAEVLLTAHHRRDQAETLLIRMAHGSGVAGLAGMRAFAEVEGVNLFRPLLDVDPAELAALVDAQGWVPVEDPSNRDPAYERVRWRQALPAMGALGLTDIRLSQLARRIERVDALAQKAATAFWERHAVTDHFGVTAIDLQELAMSHPEIGIRVLTRAIARASGEQRHDLAGIEALFARLAGGQVGGETLGGACLAPKERQLLVFRETGRMNLRSARLVPGERHVWDKRFVIEVAAPGLAVRPAKGMTRADAERLIGTDPAIPMQALGAAPLIFDAQGRVLALGSRILIPDAGIAHLALT